MYVRVISEGKTLIHFLFNLIVKLYLLSKESLAIDV